MDEHGAAHTLRRAAQVHGEESARYTRWLAQQVEHGKGGGLPDARSAAQGSAAWHRARHGKLSASRFGVAAGLSRYATPHSLWQLLAGRLDPADVGDGSSDLGRLKQMIENNGGRVVAWNDERGKITGKIDPTTRYAVLGESPEPSAEFSGALYSAINELTDQAKRNTVQQIDQRKLLNWMGRHNNATVEQLDSRIGSQFNRRQIENQLETKDLKSSDR